MAWGWPGEGGWGAAEEVGEGGAEAGAEERVEAGQLFFDFAGVEAAAEELDREPRALHRRVNPFAGRAGDEPAGIAHQHHPSTHQRVALVHRPGRVERKVGPPGLEFPRQKIALLGALEELAVEVFDALAGAQTAADADADMVELGENPAVARESVEAQADEERRPRRVAPGDFARRILEIVVRAQDEFAFIPALARSEERRVGKEC